MPNETILIVEDEPAVARGLEYGLKAEGYQVLWAKTGKKALEMARSANPQLIVLDIRLPELSGFDVCRILRQEGYRLPIIMLTARDEAMDKVLGLELGADDYVVKPYELRELIARIRAMLRRAYGELAEAPASGVLRFGELEIDQEKMQARKQGRALNLTPTEFRLLRYLATHASRPFPREALLEAIWGYSSDLGSDRTVDVHIRHLREKLEEDASQPRWVVTVRGMGYKFSP